MRLMLAMANIVQIIISDMGHIVYITFTVFSNFSNLQFVLHILTFSKLLPQWCLNHHFRQGTHSVYKIYSVLKLFEIALCSAPFDFFEITTPMMRLMLAMANIVQIIISDMGHIVYITFTVFSNFSNLQFVLHILTFLKLLPQWCLNHHFRQGTHSVYKIYSVLKLFDFAVCSAHFDFFEITTPVMRIMLTMANIVQIIISDVAQTVYIRLAVFWNFSKLLFVLHVLTFSKLLRRWCASC